MKAQLATVAFVSLMPWSSGQLPAQTERRGCRAGYSFNETSDLCELCPSGTFTDTYNWENRCQPCSACSEGRQLVSACTASSNTVCRCAEDHYEHEDGCSPKAGTTRSGIEELSPILQGIDKKIGKIDDLAKAVVISGAHSEERFQAINDRMQAHEVMLYVISVIACLLFIVVMAMIITQHRSKLVGFCRRFQRCHGAKDRKAEPGEQLLNGSHASPGHSDGRASGQPQGISPGQREHTGSTVNDGTPRAQSKGASSGMHMELRKVDTAGSLVADDDDLPTSSTLKTQAARVDVPDKDRSREHHEVEIDIHGSSNEEVRTLLPSNERN